MGLEGVIDQTYRPIEVIIVDDGSTDFSAKIISEFIDRLRRSENPRHQKLCFKLIRQNNQGPSAARNLGIEKSKGNYIAFLDADDCWEPEKLEKQIQLMDQHPSVDVVVTNARVIRKDNNHEECFIYYEKEKLEESFFGHEQLVSSPFKKLLRINFIPTSSVMAKKYCFHGKFFFNTERRYAEDLELWLKFATKFNFGYIKDALVNKKEVVGCGLSANQDKMIASKMQVIENALSKSNGPFPEGVNQLWRRKFLQAAFKWTGYHFFIQRNFRIAVKYFFASLKNKFEWKTFLYIIVAVFHCKLTWKRMHRDK